MKSLLTLFCVITLGAFALANTGDNHVKIRPIEISIAMGPNTNSIDHTKKVTTTTNQKVVRLYRRKNTLVKKALNFSTKRSKAKLA